MKINVFRAQCKTGDMVYVYGDTTTFGTVRKISADGSRALIAFDNGDISWVYYYQIELIN